MRNIFGQRQERRSFGKNVSDIYHCKCERKSALKCWSLRETDQNGKIPTSDRSGERLYFSLTRCSCNCKDMDEEARIWRSAIAETE